MVIPLIPCLPLQTTCCKIQALLSSCFFNKSSNNKWLFFFFKLDDDQEGSTNANNTNSNIPVPVELTQHDSQALSTDNNNDSSLPCTYSSSPKEVVNYDALMKKMNDMAIKMDDRFQVISARSYSVFFLLN
jgi:hypothetical protein